MKLDSNDTSRHQVLFLVFKDRVKTILAHQVVIGNGNTLFLYNGSALQ
jgi:hypothetical protein